MSVVTGIMLICSENSNEVVEQINAWLADGERYPRTDGLRRVDDYGGGGKHPQFQAWLGGFNYMDTHAGHDEFAAFVMSREWIFPENVVLVIQPEEGQSSVYRPGERLAA